MKEVIQMTTTMTNFLNEYNNATDKKEVLIRYNAKFIHNVFHATNPEALIIAELELVEFNDKYLIPNR